MDREAKWSQHARKKTRMFGFTTMSKLQSKLRFELEPLAATRNKNCTVCAPRLRVKDRVKDVSAKASAPCNALGYMPDRGSPGLMAAPRPVKQNQR